MSFLSSMDISASALTAERLRMDTIANNLANANTTRTASGEPYRRQFVIFAARTGEAARFLRADRPLARRLGVAGGPVRGGVRVIGIGEDPAPFRMQYDPGHPDADENGMVALPNVNPVTEMVDLISATRAYEANVTAINAFKSMATKALEIGRS